MASVPMAGTARNSVARGAISYSCVLATWQDASPVASECMRSETLVQADFEHMQADCVPSDCATSSRGRGRHSASRQPAHAGSGSTSASALETSESSPHACRACIAAARTSRHPSESAATWRENDAAQLSSICTCGAAPALTASLVRCTRQHACGAAAALTASVAKCARRHACTNGACQCMQGA
jgi:hypothetical protein